MKYKALSMLIILLAVSLSLMGASRNDLQAATHTQNTVYFAPTGSNLLSERDIERDNLLRVTSSAQLEAVVNLNPSVEIVYFHPDTLSEVDTEWMRSQYQVGLILAVLDIPISTLVPLLELEEVEVDDLRFDQSYDRMGVTVVRSWNIPDVLEGYIYFSEFFSDFETISDIVNRHILSVDPLNVNLPQGTISTFSKGTNNISMGIGSWWDCCGGRLFGNTVPNSYTDGSTRIYTGAGFSTYSPAPSTADTIHVFLKNSNDCGGWHTIFQGGFTASNSNEVWSDYQLVASDQCPDPSIPNQVTGKIHGSTHFVQEFNPVSGSTVEWITIPLN